MKKVVKISSFMSYLKDQHSCSGLDSVKLAIKQNDKQIII